MFLDCQDTLLSLQHFKLNCIICYEENQINVGRASLHLKVFGEKPLICHVTSGFNVRICSVAIFTVVLGLVIIKFIIIYDVTRMMI